MSDRPVSLFAVLVAASTIVFAARIEGDCRDYRGFIVWDGKNAEHAAQFGGKSYGTICVHGVLYSWIVPDQPDTGGPRDHYRYIELARSTDHGAHWTKAEAVFRVEPDRPLSRCPRSHEDRSRRHLEEMPQQLAADALAASGGITPR